MPVSQLQYVLGFLNQGNVKPLALAVAGRFTLSFANGRNCHGNQLFFSPSCAIPGQQLRYRCLVR